MILSKHKLRSYPVPILSCQYGISWILLIFRFALRSKQVFLSQGKLHQNSEYSQPDYSVSEVESPITIFQEYGITYGSVENYALFKVSEHSLQG